MNSLNEIKFHQIIEEVPELTHISPELEHLLLKHSNLDTSKKNKSAKKILEDIIDNFANNKNGQSVMNFIPSNPGGNCMPLCVGMATQAYGGKRDEIKHRTGFKGLMIDIIRYWIRCGSVNTKTILFTVQFNNEHFDENWRSILDEYKAKGKVVKVFYVLNDQLIEVYK
jgi:hypothetical protein